MPIVGGGITGNAQSRGGTPSPEKTEELIDQAVQTFFTPEKIEELGYAQSEDIPTDAEITTIATDTITPLIDGFLSESEIEALGYQTADEVAALIAPRIAGFLTQAQIEMLGYIDTAGANTLINQALTSYAQSDEIRTDAEINTLITSMLSGYAQASDIRTDTEITTIATNTITPLIADFLTQTQIEALGYQTAAEVSAIVSPLIANFLTQAQIELLGYIDADNANDLISNALTDYAQSGDIRTDAEINALITTMLLGYAQSSDIRTDTEITTIATNTISPLIANFLSQSEIEALGYQTAAEVSAIVSPLIANFLTQAQIQALGYIDTDTANALITAALAGYAQSSEIRTDAEINALITAMLSGYAQTSDIRTDAEIETIATNTITPLIVNFLSQTQIEALGYQTAAEVAALITPRIANFLTQAQVEALGYLDTASTNALITASLAGYAQTDDIRTDAEINTLITAMLSGYARTSDIRTDAEIETIATNTITPLIADFLTQSEIEALGYQTADQVSALITPRISNFLTQAQIEALGYLDTETASTLITEALVDYAQSGDIRTDNEINALITAMLNGYAKLSDLRTDTELANFIDTLGIQSNAQLTTKVIRQENLTRYAAAVFGQSIDAEAGVVLGKANFVDISDPNNPTDLETEWAFSTNTFGKIDKPTFNSKCNELLTANTAVTHIEVQVPSFNIQSHGFSRSGTFSATPTSPNAILGYTTGQGMFEWAYVGENGLPWLANPYDTEVEYSGLLDGSDAGDSLKKLHLALFKLFDSPRARVEAGDDNIFPGYQVDPGDFDARISSSIPSSDTDFDNIDTSGERIVYMKIDDVIPGNSNPGSSWEIGFDEQRRWASEGVYQGHFWNHTHIKWRQAAIGFLLESHVFEDPDNNAFRDIIKPRNSDGLYNAIAEPKRILTDSDRADLSDYISNRLRLVSEGTADPTDTTAVSGSNQIYIKHDSDNKLVSIWASGTTESGWTEFVVPTPPERFILISEGENFPTAGTENTDKILIDRRGDIPTLYANRVTDVEATEEMWQFGEIDTAQFPDYLGSHAAYTGPRTDGQYLYRTDLRAWYQFDGTSFVPVEPTTLFTNYVGSYDTEAAAIAALPTDYTETDTYIFVINNEPQQLLSYTPAVDAYTTYEWEQINTLPTERQGVQLLNEQEVGLQTNLLHSVPNLNASVMHDYERFYCMIRVNNNQIGGFAFSYDAWAALTTQNEQTNISTANGSLQVGILRINSTNNIHIGARNNTERSFMIALRGLSGTSLGNPADCHISVWGYKH